MAPALDLPSSFANRIFLLHSDVNDREMDSKQE